MSTPHKPGLGGPTYRPVHGRKMSRRRSDAVKRKNRKPFQPEFHGLEKRMMPATFLVNTVADSGAGSLRQAITDSNATPGSNLIDFGIGTGAQTISLLSALPSIMVPVVIDGTSQPGYTNAPLIDIDGTSAGAGANGLVLGLGSDGTTIRALVINNFAGAGISITTTDNAVQGSFIGTDAAGTAAGNQPMANGIIVSGASNTIGGTAAGAGNVISGNAGEGVEISGSGATGNTVEGNLIGTDASGENPLGNTADGILLSGTTENTIGGPTAASRNVIASDGLRGIEFAGANSNLVENNFIGTDALGSIALSIGHNGILDQGISNTFVGNVIDASGNIGLVIQGNSTLVQGNLIGLNAAGTAALGNTGAGITIKASGNTIGGTTAATRNIISGTINGNGIAITSGTADNLIQGNYIGTNAAGTAALANTVSGIDVQGSSGNTIGGATGTPGTGAGNLISGNANDGVTIEVGSTDTSILGNIIGLDETGTVALGNGSSTIGNGVTLNGSLDTIGGTIAADRNIISGNYLRGVQVGGTSELVEGNYIGTDITGIVGLGNGLIAGYAGVYISSADNTIGGTVAGAGNLLDDSGTEGIRIDTTAATGNLVAGNEIGVNAAGNALPNHFWGMLISTASANTIGGTVVAAANVISGNDFEGIDISGSDNLVEGNEIGTNPAGNVALGNSGGVIINNGGTGNTIGGATTAAANVISGNTAYGIQVDGSTTIGNVVANNFVGTGPQGSGTLLNSGGALEITNSAAVLAQGGFTGNVLNQGTLGFWNPPGVTTITGNFTQSSAGTLDVDLGGSSPAEHDQLQVSGTATLAGALDVTLIDGFSISPLEEFQILTYGTLSGAFASEQYPSGVTLFPGYGPTSLFLYSTPFELVTTTADTGAGSLRQAITAADGLSNDPTWIVFNIPTSDSGFASGIWTIAPDSALPNLSAQVVLDGTTQPGFTAAPIIVLSGGSAGSSAAGVTVVAGGSGSTVRGFVVNGFAQDGIDLDGASDTTIEGNYIGTDITGTVAVPNFSGVQIDSGAAGNTIGGLTALARNVISGNNAYGVLLPEGGNANVVEGNFVGTDATGDASLSNNQGILVQGLDNTIGGTASGAGNVISGNDVSPTTGGFFAGNQLLIGNVFGFETTGNLVEGNLIGLGANGQVIAGATNGGVYIADDSSGNTIGGTTAAARNVISGNKVGVYLTSDSGNVVEGNFIGTDTTGTVAIGNNASGDNTVFGGIVIQGNSDDTIGGTAAGAGNVISGNQIAGVYIFDDSTEAVIEGNSIGTNAAGTAALSNSGDGVHISGDEGSSSDITIGGAIAGAGNLISGNTGTGVEFGGANTTGIVVQGNLIGTDSSGTAAIANGTGVGLETGASGNTIGGTTALERNVLSGNGYGVFLQGGANANVIEGNYIGTDANGDASLPNFYGIMNNAADETIGGTAAGAGNVISGNTGNGVEMSGTGSTDNLVIGNLIGTNAAGSAAIANNNGVKIDTGATGNTIGGTTVLARNIISGNTMEGVEIDTGAAGNTVEGDYIGTDSSGNIALGNAIGVDITSAANTIGGTASGAGNVITGNDGSGFLGAGSQVLINQTGAHDNPDSNVIEGNLIGLDAAGAALVGSTYVGVYINFGVGNTIGGSTAAARNVISGNQGGVLIQGGSANVVSGNYVGTDTTGSQAIGNGSPGDDITIQSSDNTIGGTTPATRNIIASSASAGIYMLDSGATDNLIEGNFIGTDKTGTIALPNVFGINIASTSGGNTIGGATSVPGTGAGNLISFNGGGGIALGGEPGGDVVLGNAIANNGNPPSPVVGVTINSSNDVQIGGASPGDANLISGNTGAGVSINSSTATLLEGNLIGTNLAGMAADPNGDAGVGVDAASTGTTIGGTVAGAGNVISGNSGAGIEVSSSGTLIVGNWIGTNGLGTAALGNAGDGVFINQSSGNTIGGTSPTSANLISGNDNGVELSDTTLNLVQGNMIGTDTTGTLALGNTGAGVLIDNGSSANTIGGPVGGARNLISGNAEGVEVIGATTTVVAGNLIGTDLDGTSSVPNLSAGVSISGGSGTTIGGSTILARNIISANAGDGVDLSNGATDTLIQNNYVGVDQTGTQPLGNAGDGISIDSAPKTTIGGTAQGSGNVISANAQAGVSIQGSASTGIAILGNFIGTDFTATIDLGNGTFGVVVGDPPTVTIGGTGAGARNIISGNKGAGVGLVAGATGELVEGNLIGTDITGSNPLGNGTGVLIDGGSANNTIGGSAGAGNTIAYSAGIGVDVDATAGAGNDLRLNSIFSNSALGIDLGGDGVTLNNSVPHTGPNDHQNFPVITGLSSAGGTTTVTGTFNSTPSTTFTLDFYTMSSFNASDYGEGRYLLGSAPITTDTLGNATFSVPFPAPSSGANFVSATATDPSGNTSEFSHDFGSDAPPTAVIGFTSLTVDEGVAIPFDASESLDPQGSPLSYSWSFGDGATATGVDPIHTYRAVGTFNVMLTVNDGFGGISSATAAITVNDVPPAFVPRAFTPPVTFASPTPGDGFGAAVASVAGNAAIGAPFDNGPSATDHPGAVFLYDGVPTDDGVSTTYAYKSLIHVFADPNPAAGDEFGAAIATVGTDLLIGAPGSSLTGEGDGAAYLFDADPSSPTFGTLLATFTLPDPDSVHQAEFGAAVAAANTTILIGAPGKDGGSGEVVAFAGDPTQPTFGSPLFHIADPDHLAGARFGAAIAGISNNLIVAAPFDNTAGSGAGIVYLFAFSGTTATQTGAIVNPHPAVSTGFGTAVASVGPNVLIGSPLDATAGPGAGAAFLYSPSGTLLKSFVQPDDGGGHFGASVAGSGTTALIGAPGATLGTGNAGAAYLFDANPSSSIFGQPIAAEQESTPVTGDAFGSAVGFLDINGALLIGALGAASSGAEAADLYQPGAPLSVSATTTYATAAPFDSVIVSGTFVVPGNFDTLTGSIDWGDGSAPTLITLPPGSYAFSVPHDYTSASVSRYAIGVTLSDALGETAFAQAVVLMSDPAPAFAAPGLVLSSSSINEHGSVTVSGTIGSPGGSQTNTVAIDWGDGSTPTMLVLPAGTFTFSTPHTYLNNPPGVASGSFAVSAQVTNQQGQIGQASASVTVSNVAPQFTAADLSLSEPTATEGDTITLNGRFTDPGTLDPHTVTIGWGDGSIPTALTELAGQVVATATPGLFTYSVTHQYLNNPPGEPTGGSYDIHVSVSDDVSTTSADRIIVVNNAPPSVRIESTGSFGSGTISLTAVVNDPGALDTETLAWTLTQNGSVIATAPGASFSFNTPSPVGVLVATATATDSDGGTGSDSAQIVLILEGNATATITTSGITISQGGSTVESDPSAGAGLIIGLVYGSNDLVDASSLPATTDVELDGYGSSETLLGGAGDDLLSAGAGANSLAGGVGDDTLVSNRGDDTLEGGLGNDLYRIDPGPDPALVDPGGFNTLDFSIAALPVNINLGLDSGQVQDVDSADDEVALDGQFDGLIASPKGGNITANDGNDLIYATTGNTTITGGSGHETLTGGSGNDIIFSTTGNTTITGGSGSESLVGGSGNDIIYSTTGNTTITGGSGHETLVGGQGNDIIYSTTGNTTITGGSGSESLVGGSGNDIIYSTTGNTTITGGSGSESLVGGSGNDIFY